MVVSNKDEPSRKRLGWTHLAICAFVLLVLVGVGISSPFALLTVVLDGAAAGLVLIPAMLAGAWLVPVIGCQEMPLRWHFLIGASLGLGLLSLLVLVLGLAGCLERTLWIGLAISSMVLGVARWWLLLSDTGGRAREAAIDVTSPHTAWWWLWVLVVPFAILALLAASTAPGFIWSEEGFGYDILEYHLQMPKEYYQAGRIAYAPHNVYANFPANVEMLYLLAMVLLNDVYDIGAVANMIHLTFAVLTVFAAWVVGREWSQQAGVICGVITATVGWLVYLSGVAYIENAMLFWGMVATAVVLRFIVRDGTSAGCGAVSDREAHVGGWGAVILAGAAAGFSCGCKYTAVPLIAGPLAVVILLSPSKPMSRRIIQACLFGAATTVAFSPWLIKNQSMTGNPVFPLANSVLKASPPGWGVEETQRWDRGHRAQPDERNLGARFKLLGRHVVTDRYQRFGPAIFVLALGGLFGRRRGRVDCVLLLILVFQLACWLFATHLFARFAVVLLIPLALLAGRSALVTKQMARQTALVVVLVLGGIWNAAFALKLNVREGAAGAPASLMYEGRLPEYAYLQTVNRELPVDANILLVGDAKAFYFQRRVDYCTAFNRSPFLEMVKGGGSPEEVAAWLRGRGYSYVLVNWSELKRLASTYGFSPSMDLERIESLFDQLHFAGVRRTQVYSHPSAQGRYVELYEVSP